MSLLMPEYDRQLRAAARRLAGDSQTSSSPSRGGLGSWVLLGLAGVLTVIVAVAGVVVIGHRGSDTSAVGGPRPAIQYNCPRHEILRAKGPLVPTAHGTVAGRRWTLELDSARHGLRSVQAGRLTLGRRAYGFCQTRPSVHGFPSGALDVELVNAGPHGIVYGLASRLYRPPIVIEATTAHGTRRHPVAAYKYPAMIRQVPRATIFLRALPKPACAYDQLSLSAQERSTSSGTGLGVDVFYTFTRSCAPGQLRHSR
jgi:hypothetical protein